jgi:hypothetical protein
MTVGTLWGYACVVCIGIAIGVIGTTLSVEDYLLADPEASSRES